jgi:hypothetical protein
MEESVFPRPAVKSELERFVRVELHLDAQEPPELVARSERYAELQQRKFGTNAMPYYAIVEPDGETVVATFDEGYTTDIEKFVEFLRKG